MLSPTSASRTCGAMGEIPRATYTAAASPSASTTTTRRTSFARSRARRAARGGGAERPRDVQQQRPRARSQGRAVPARDPRPGPGTGAVDSPSHPDRSGPLRDHARGRGGEHRHDVPRHRQPAGGGRGLEARERAPDIGGGTPCTLGAWLDQDVDRDPVVRVRGEVRRVDRRGAGGRARLPRRLQPDLGSGETLAHRLLARYALLILSPAPREQPGEADAGQGADASSHERESYRSIRDRARKGTSEATPGG